MPKGDRSGKGWAAFEREEGEGRREHGPKVAPRLQPRQATTPTAHGAQAKAPLYQIAVSCLVDRRRSSIVPWIPPVDRVSSRSSSGIRFSTVLAALGTCGTSGPPIARDPDPRTAFILFGFEVRQLFLLFYARFGRHRLFEKHRIAEKGIVNAKKVVHGGCGRKRAFSEPRRGGIYDRKAKGNRQSRDRGSTRCDSLIITIESTRTSPCIADPAQGWGWVDAERTGRPRGGPRCRGAKKTVDR